MGELREPRVGDGVLILDREQRIEYASPNATSALHRLGVLADPIGQTLTGLGVDDVLNGIAHDPTTGLFLLTGKRWPVLFEVEFVPAG